MISSGIQKKIEKEDKKFAPSIKRIK